MTLYILKPFLILMGLFTNKFLYLILACLIVNHLSQNISVHLQPYYFFTHPALAMVPQFLVATNGLQFVILNLEGKESML